MTLLMENVSLNSRVIKTEAVDWRSFKFLQTDKFKSLEYGEKRKLATSILANNFTQPFYVWQDPADDVVYCLDGWHRSLVMKELEDEGVKIPFNLPATFIECSSKQEAAKLVLIYSSMYAKVTEAGFLQFIDEYDLNPLEVFDQVSLPECSFDIKISDRDIELQEDDFNEEEELGKIFLPLSRRDDVFELGDHLLICADSRNLQPFREHLVDRRAKMIYCDPPYNISYNYESGLNPSRKKYTNKSFSDSLKDEDYMELIKFTLAEGLTYCQQDAVHVFYWCDESYIWLIQEAFRKWGLDLRRVCFWIKDRLNPVPQIAFNKVIECCVYATFGKPSLNPEFTNFTEVWNTDMKGSHNLDDLMSITQVWMEKRDNVNHYQHPTTKPIRLHEKPLKRCSVQGDTVMDLFGGSGSTLIACEQLSRRSVLVEQDCVFVDLIIRRYIAYCNKKGIEVSFKHCNGNLTLKDFAHEPITEQIADHG